MKTKSKLIEIPISQSKWKLIYEQLKNTQDLSTGDGGRFKSIELERLTDIAYRGSKGIEWKGMLKTTWEGFISCLSVRGGLPETCAYIQSHIDGKPCQPTSPDTERRDELGLSEKSVCIALNDGVMAMAHCGALLPKQDRLKLFAWGLLAGSILAIWALVL